MIVVVEVPIKVPEQVHRPSPSSRLGLLQPNGAGGFVVVEGGTNEGPAVRVTPVGKMVGQRLPGPPEGVIIAVEVPTWQVHNPLPSSRLGLLHSIEGAIVVVVGIVELGAPPPLVGEPETGDWDPEAVLLGFVEVGVVLLAVGETAVGFTETEPRTLAGVAVFTEAEGCV